MTPSDRDLLGRYLVDRGWEPDGHGGWYSPHRAWHVDVELATDTQLVLSRRGGWSTALRCDDVVQAVALLRAYRVLALPPQRCARCAATDRDSWPGRLVAGQAHYDRVELGPEPDDADVDGYPLGRAAKGGA